MFQVEGKSMIDCQHEFINNFCEKCGGTRMHDGKTFINCVAIPFEPRKVEDIIREWREKRKQIIDNWPTPFAI